MDTKEWERLDALVRKYVPSASEDSLAHVAALIPRLVDKPIPEKWRTTRDKWVIQLAKRAAFKHAAREARRGFTGREGASYVYLDIDEPVDEEGSKLGDTIFGDWSPEDWLIAFETVGEMKSPKEIHSERSRATQRKRWDKARLTRLIQEEQCS